MKKGILIGIAIGTIATIGATSMAALNTVENFRSMNYGGFEHHKMMDFSERTEMKTLLKTGNYQEFVKNFKGEGHKPTKKQFDRRVAMYQAREAGDNVKFEKLREEMHQGRQTHRDEMEKVVESGDYNAFKKLAKERMGEITEDTFLKIQEMHKAREEGNLEKMENLRKELQASGSGMGRHEHRGMIGEHMGMYR